MSIKLSTGKWGVDVDMMLNRFIGRIAMRYTLRSPRIPYFMREANKYSDMSLHDKNKIDNMT